VGEPLFRAGVSRGAAGGLAGLAVPPAVAQLIWLKCLRMESSQ
jgi:hypothetical protein